jgi:hypothetical protein
MATTTPATSVQRAGSRRSSDVLIYLIGILSEEEPREARGAKRALYDLIGAWAVDYYPADGPRWIKSRLRWRAIRNPWYAGSAPTNAVMMALLRKITVNVNAPGCP